jgi:glycosyltransferase involved in cell wall biosynthesis
MILALLRIPYVVHLHGSGYDTYYRDAPQILKFFIRFLFVHAELAVVLGEHWYQFLVSSLRVPSKRVRIVYNGVPDHGVMKYTTKGHILITSIGLVGTRKGTDVLLDALARLPKQVAWKCIIAGNGEVRHYKQISAKLGIEDRVEFLGWVNEQQVTALLHRTDVFVLPSRYENQPLTILEAMAAGLPVISTRIGAIPEQVRDGVSGILVDPGDVRALRDALLRLIEDPRTRADMGRVGRQRYEECFSAKTFAEGIIAVYREVLATIGREQ